MFDECLFLLIKHKLLVPEGDAHEAGVAYGLAVRVNVLELAGRVFQGDRVDFALLQDNQAAEGPVHDEAGAFNPEAG